jgi:sialidase-1
LRIWLRATAAAAALLTVLAVPAIPAAARPASRTACTSALWTAGSGGYDTYRIPAVVTVGSTLVAFAEGRRDSDADSGDIEIVERRSVDGGCTWTPTQVTTDAWHDTVDNPVPLVAADGTLVLLSCWQRGTVTQQQIQDGQVSAQDGRRIFVQTSADAGATWTARREITSQVKTADWLWYATGPGHGVTVRYGKAVGRLLVAANHSAAGGVVGGHTLISDDNGQDPQAN